MLSSKNSFHHNFENWKFFISSFVLAMFSILILSKLFLLLTFFALLTLFYTGGGGPGDPPCRYILCYASVDAPMELKFHDFVPFNIF